MSTERDFLGNDPDGDLAAEKHGIKIALARQELVAQSCGAAAAMLASAGEKAKGHITQDWDTYIQGSFEAIDQCARELTALLEGE